MAVLFRLWCCQLLGRKMISFRANAATLLLCLLIHFGESKSGKTSESSSDHSQSVPTCRIVVVSFRMDHMDPTYIDEQRTETKIVQVNETTQRVDGQWVIKKDIPLNVVVRTASWKFQREGHAAFKKPNQNLCSEILAPMTGLNMFYSNIGFTKCPVKKGVYTFNNFVLPSLSIPKALAMTTGYKTTYEWLMPGQKQLLKFTSVVRFVPNT